MNVAPRRHVFLVLQSRNVTIRGGPRSNSLCHKDLRGAKSGATGVKSGASGSFPGVFLVFWGKISEPNWAGLRGTLIFSIFLCFPLIFSIFLCYSLFSSVILNFPLLFSVILNFPLFSSVIPNITLIASIFFIRHHLLGILYISPTWHTLTHFPPPLNTRGK